MRECIEPHVFLAPILPNYYKTTQIESKNNIPLPSLNEIYVKLDLKKKNSKSTTYKFNNFDPFKEKTICHSKF